ncbi:MAG: UDP-N-acetylmuramoyl-tripeptide--D-alanyl-D-alanine ligase [Acidobacteriia bacterium]|nr:UDP-N-acetylmuramoyl-tripeptide--D-alanyl-D-alanine ligase [Terriglobia bacterium]
MQLALGEVATVLGSSCGFAERLARGYAIDSRTLAPGELFFAIRGPHFDGHQFVEDVLGRGAVGAVVEQAFYEQSPETLRPALIAVDDTPGALQGLARAVRRRWDRRLVAITGSTGKSTTKEMTAAILAERYSVLKSEGNLNNHYGLPLTLLGLEPGHDVAVVELAMSAPGEIARLTRIAEPQVGAVTNVAPVHLQFFESVDGIARAKRELLENMPAGSTAVLNFDDPRARTFAEGFKGRVVTFGFDPHADWSVAEVGGDAVEGSRFRVRGGVQDAEFRLGLPGRHNIQNALAAIAIASLFDVSPAEAGKALAHFRPLPQRSEILTLPEGIVLINDCYNSNPLAMETMLETLAPWPGARRRIVVAGEMLELGPTSPDLHRQVGRKCVECHVDRLFAVQGDARLFLEGAREAGFPEQHCRFFSTAEEAGEFCRKALEPGDVVLIKGSRAVHLEKVTQLLKSVGAGVPAARDAESRS